MTMREILFRGKRTDNGEWVYGYVGVFKGITQIFVPFTEEEEKENEGHIFSCIGGLWYTVNPETVGQFTGLTDKNGNKIFEGDIVKREYTLWHGETKKTRETQIGVVAYSNKECGFWLEKVCNLRRPWDGDTSEVIGNIHDNPELLEVTDNA